MSPAARAKRGLVRRSGSETLRAVSSSSPLDCCMDLSNSWVFERGIGGMFVFSAEVRRPPVKGDLERNLCIRVEDGLLVWEV